MRKVRLEGFVFYRAIPPADIPAKELAEKIRAAANTDDALASFVLAETYFYGRGTPLAEAVAVEWYRKAAEHGSIEAQNNLGILYATGHGVDASPAIAVDWLHKAAETGRCSAAHTNLGMFFNFGISVGRDFSEAADHFLKAALVVDDAEAEPFVPNEVEDLAIIEKRPA